MRGGLPIKEFWMFYHVVIYECYDGKKMLGWAAKNWSEVRKNKQMSLSIMPEKKKES